MLTRLWCFLGMHRWDTIHAEPLQILQRCPDCGALRTGMRRTTWGPLAWESGDRRQPQTPPDETKSHK